MTCTAALLASACGPPCQSIVAKRASLKRPKPDTTRPHAQLIVPFDKLNVLLTRGLQPVPSLKLNPAVSLLGMLTGITLEARSIRVVPARKGYVGIQVHLAFAGDASPVTSMTVDIEVKPTIVRDKHRVQLALGFGADTLRQVRPRFAKGVRARVTSAIERRLPSVMRNRVPKIVLVAAAGKVLAFLSQQGFALIRSQLLDRVGQLTRTLVSLPELPITEVRTSSVNYPTPSLRFDIYTSLPVVRGLDTGKRSKPVRGTLRVRVANSTIAQAANWALETGRLPKRYGDNLQPDKEGQFRPVLQWRTGNNRPLAVHVFRTKGECMYVRAGVQPTLKLQKGEFVASYEDRKYEQVEGNLLVKFGVWLKRWLAWFGYKSKKVAAKTAVTVGGKKVQAQVTGARLGDNELRVDVALTFGN